MKHSKKPTGITLGLSWKFLVEETTTRSTCKAGTAKDVEWDLCRFRDRS